MLFFGASKKSTTTFTSGKKKVRAKSPSSAARKVFKSVKGYKSKGPRVISVKNSDGKVFRYRVRLIKLKKTVEIEGKSITYKYRIKVKALGKNKKSPTKSTKSSKSTKSTKSKTSKSGKACKTCKSKKCRSCSIRPASGAWY